MKNFKSIAAMALAAIMTVTAMAAVPASAAKAYSLGTSSKYSQSVSADEQPNHKRIGTVRRAHYTDYPHVSIGEGIDNYFEDTEWTYYLSLESVIVTGNVYSEDKVMSCAMAFTFEKDGSFSLSAATLQLNGTGEVTSLDDEGISDLIDIIFEDQEKGAVKVEFVQESKLKAYPTVPIGACIDDFFEDTEWSYDAENDYVDVSGSARYGNKDAEFFMGFKFTDTDRFTLAYMFLVYEDNGEYVIFDDDEMADIIDQVFSQY